VEGSIPATVEVQVRALRIHDEFHWGVARGIEDEPHLHARASVIAEGNDTSEQRALMWLFRANAEAATAPFAFYRRSVSVAWRCIAETGDDSPGNGSRCGNQCREPDPNEYIPLQHDLCPAHRRQLMRHDPADPDVDVEWFERALRQYWSVYRSDAGDAVDRIFTAGG
jgi:hypothetical protein